MVIEISAETFGDVQSSANEQYDHLLLTRGANGGNQMLEVDLVIAEDGKHWLIKESEAHGVCQSGIVESTVEMLTADLTRQDVTFVPKHYVSRDQASVLQFISEWCAGSASFTG